MLLSQKSSQLDSQFHPVPRAVAAVLVLRFCRILWEFLQATGGNDIGTVRPRTGDH